MNDRGRVLGLATGDVLLLLAVLAVGLALAYPSIQGRRVRREVDAAVEAVDAVRAAAERYHARTGTWPEDPGGHALPPELASALTTAPDAGPPRTALDWSVWEILEEPEAPGSLEPPTTPARLPARDTVVHPPPEVGKLAGIAVRSGDPRILAELLLRYASERSFVRDSTWTLVLGGVHRRR